MAIVVFLRGVNVGGNKAFRPAALAKDLAKLEVVNIGAAGTFVVRKPIAQTKLRGEIARRLPFEAEIMMCAGAHIEALVADEPFPREASAPGVRRFVSVLAKKPTKPFKLPIRQPEGAVWQVKIVAIEGNVALSLMRRPAGAKLVYPNEVVEKKLDVAATTRGWDTLVKIRDVLDAV